MPCELRNAWGARVCDPQQLRQTGRVQIGLWCFEIRMYCGSQSRAPRIAQPFKAGVLAHENRKSRRDGRTVLSSLTGLWDFGGQEPTAEAVGYFQRGGWRQRFRSSRGGASGGGESFHHAVSPSNRVVLPSNRAVMPSNRAVLPSNRAVLPSNRAVLSFCRAGKGRILWVFEVFDPKLAFRGVFDPFQPRRGWRV